MLTFKEFIQKIEEEVPVNSVGSGNVQGLATEPVIRRRSQVKYIKRNQKVFSQGLEASQ